MKNALQLLRELCELLALRRDAEAALALLTEDFCWFGTRAPEPGYTRAQLRGHIQALIYRLPAGGSLCYEQERCAPTGEGGSVGYARVRLSWGQGVLTCGLSAVSRQKGGRSRLCALHLSLDEESVSQGVQAQVEDLMSNVACGLIISRVSPERGVELEYLNDGYFAICEIERETLLALYEQDILTGVYPEDAGRVGAFLDELGADPKDCELSYRYVTPAGKIKWVLLNVRAVKHADGTATTYSTYLDVSEQQRLSQRLSDLIQTVPCGICLYLWDGVTLLPLVVNRQFTELLGEDALRTVDGVQQRDYSAVHPDDLSGFMAAVSGALCGNGRVDHSHRVFNKARGQYLWVRVRSTMLDQPDGRRLAYVSYYDVTEEHRVAERLRENERLLEAKYELERRRPSLGEENLLAHVLYNLSSREFLEYRYRDGTSVPAQDRTLFTFAERSAELLIDDEERRRFLALQDIPTLLERFARGETEFSLDYRRRLPGGELVWVRSLLHLVRHPTSGDVLLFGYWYNVDEEVTRAQMYRSLAVDNYDYVARIDGRTRRFVVFPQGGSNQRMPPLSGEDADEVARSIYEQHVPAEDRAMAIRNTLVENIRANLRQHGRFQFTYRERQPDGSLHHKRITQYYLDEQRELIMMTREDVTGLIRAEAEKNAALAAALEAANLASSAKSQFLSHMSHELRTPMNAIIGLSTLAAGEADDPAAMENAIGKIGQSARYLLSLINDILEMSRIESGHISLNEAPFDFGQLIASVNAIIHGQAEAKGVRYSAKVKGAVEPSYVGDRTKLQQILVNVLGNSVKFTRPDGRVSLLVEQLRRDEKRAALRFVISDTGEGIEESFMPHLFEAFSQESAGSTSTTAGTGLGLAITKSMVELMNGRIYAQSVKGSGSVFHVELELGVCPPETPQQLELLAARSPALPDFSGRRILLAEDHPLNIEVARRLLERTGAQVEVVGNGLEALDAFAAAPQGHYDAILMDVRMPVMDGLTAAQSIRALRKPGSQDVPIIAMTANAFDEDVQRSFSHGMDAHLIKPIDPQLLYATLAKNLRRGPG